MENVENTFRVYAEHLHLPSISLAQQGAPCVYSTRANESAMNNGFRSFFTERGRRRAGGVPTLIVAAAPDTLAFVRSGLVFWFRVGGERKIAHTSLLRRSQIIVVLTGRFVGCGNRRAAAVADIATQAEAAAAAVAANTATTAACGETAAVSYARHHEHTHQNRFSTTQFNYSAPKRPSRSRPCDATAIIERRWWPPSKTLATLYTLSYTSTPRRDSYVRITRRVACANGDKATHHHAWLLLWMDYELFIFLYFLGGNTCVYVPVCVCFVLLCVSQRKISFCCYAFILNTSLHLLMYLGASVT